MLSTIALFDQVKAAGPRFLASQRPSHAHASLSTPLGSIYEALHEYADPGDQGGGEINTVYKAIHGLSRSINDASLASADQPFDFATAVTPTIALRMSVEKYTRGGSRMVMQSDGVRTDSWAMDRDSQLVKVLFASSANSPKKQVYDIVQCNFDPVLGSVELSFCTTRSAGVCAPRLWLKGNSLTHAFQLMGIVCNHGAASAAETFISYAAAGTARGTGQYMVFRFVWTALGVSHDSYYKIPADSSDADLMFVHAICPNGMTAAEARVADTMGYIENLPAPLFVKAQGGRRLTDYANSNMLVLKEPRP